MSHVGPPLVPEPYPFAQLDEAKNKAIANGIEVIDFGMGDPREPTPEFIRLALGEAVTPVSSYPRAGGLPELRDAIAEWIERRFGVALDASAEIIPTLGAKEIIHSLAAYTLREGKDVIAVPSPAYPVYARGATFHGAQVYDLPLLQENEFLPDLDAVPSDIWQRTSILWVNYPNNPTGATAPLAFYERAAELAREYDFILASDEAYTEIYFGAKPVSALQLTDRRNVVAINTLSKRSCMTGYRSGFIAGDAVLLERLRTYRPSVGVTPQDFVQRASVQAWNDELHVETFREQWQTKFNVINGALAQHGLGVGSEATFFLWVKTPANHTSASFAEYLIGNGIVVTPGSAFGAAGEGYVRFATVPSLEDCERAALKLKEIL